MFYCIVIVFALFACVQWNNGRQKAYKEIADLKSSIGPGAEHYPLFQKIIDNDAKGFKQLWLSPGPYPHQVILQIEVMSYILTTNLKTYNMYEIGFRHHVTDIVGFLLDQNAERPAFFYGLRTIPIEQQTAWLTLLEQHHGLGTIRDNARDLSQVLRSSTASPPILHYLKAAGVSFNPHWYDKDWKVDRSLMKESAGNYQWHDIATLWPFLSDEEQKIACEEIAGPMKKFSTSSQSNTVNDETEHTQSARNDAYEVLKNILHKSGCVLSPAGALKQ